MNVDHPTTCSSASDLSTHLPSPHQNRVGWLPQTEHVSGCVRMPTHTRGTTSGSACLNDWRCRSWGDACLYRETMQVLQTNLVKDQRKDWWPFCDRDLFGFTQKPGMLACRHVVNVGLNSPPQSVCVGLEQSHGLVWFPTDHPSL